MTLEKMRAVFAALSTCTAWSLQLLKINTSKHRGTSYSGREITLSPEGALASFVAEISDRYINGSKAALNSYHDITEYNGSTVDRVIYWLKKTNKLISDEYDALIAAIANPDAELNPLEFKAKAYVLRGIVHLDGEEKPIKLISMQNPVTSLKHKFLGANGTFTEITDKVISLRTSIDVIIMEDTVYMFTLAGENLFNMERAYRAACAGKLNEIEHSSIVNDFAAFSSVAGSGHNPRKFVSFNDSHLQKLKNSRSRAKMARKFSIPMSGDLFDTTQPGATDKIVKLLCDRGMIDPFDDNPMEVAGSKKWE
nr:Kiwa anti-phage protein KwaB-like domain-containing protein [Acutalibacter muris]